MLHKQNFIYKFKTYKYAKINECYYGMNLLCESKFEIFSISIKTIQTLKI